MAMTKSIEIRTSIQLPIRRRFDHRGSWLSEARVAVFQVIAEGILLMLILVTSY